MWLSKKLVNKTKTTLPENGKVTISSSEVNGTKQSRGFATYAPYGMTYVVPTGASVLMVPSAVGESCCGVEMESTKDLNVGEIKIKSMSGAYILFRADGTVLINNVEITKNGEIYCTKVVEGSVG